MKNYKSESKIVDIIDNFSSQRRIIEEIFIIIL